MENLLDEYLLEFGIDELKDHCKKVEEWKEVSKEKVRRSKFVNLRWKQYQKAIDDEHMFRFEMQRSQTRYSQTNYVKSSYQVMVTVETRSYNFAEIEERFKQLATIGFECTLAEYHASNQRRLMTKTFREEIAKRDNYTCRICGKYMPDWVGLQIDHIIPIAKGGKSVESNLQVLCSKCNGRKSSSVEE